MPQTLLVANTLPPLYLTLAIGIVAIFGYALPIALIFLAAKGRYLFASAIALVDLIVFAVIFRGVVDLSANPSTREIVLLIIMIGMPLLIYLTGLVMLASALIKQMAGSNRK